MTLLRGEGRSGKAGAAELESVMAVDVMGVEIPEVADEVSQDRWGEDRWWFTDLWRQHAPRVSAAKQSTCYLGMLRIEMVSKRAGWQTISALERI